MIKKETIQWPQYVMCPSVVVFAVDHIVAPSPSNNTRKICILICAWNNYVSYTLACVHFIMYSMYVSSCSTPSFSSPANSSQLSPAFLVLHFWHYWSFIFSTSHHSMLDLPWPFFSIFCTRRRLKCAQTICLTVGYANLVHFSQIHYICFKHKNFMFTKINGNTKTH